MNYGLVNYELMNYGISVIMKCELVDYALWIMERSSAFLTTHL